MIKEIHENRKRHENDKGKATKMIKERHENNKESNIKIIKRAPETPQKW